jgi:hypothetical protein
MTSSSHEQNDLTAANQYGRRPGGVKRLFGRPAFFIPFFLFAAAAIAAGGCTRQSAAKGDGSDRFDLLVEQINRLETRIEQLEAAAATARQAQETLPAKSIEAESFEVRDSQNGHCVVKLGWDRLTTKMNPAPGLYFFNKNGTVKLALFRAADGVRFRLVDPMNVVVRRIDDPSVQPLHPHEYD